MYIRSIRAAVPELNRRGFDLTERILRLRISCGELPTVTIMGRKMVDVDELERLLTEAGGTIGTAELSEKTGLPRYLIRRMAREGVLPCISTEGQNFRFRENEAMEAIRKLTD